MKEHRNALMRKNTLHLAIQVALMAITPLALASTGAEPRTGNTGSLIESDAVDAAEFLILDRGMIDRSGHIQLGELLQELPQAGSDLNLQFNNGGNGETRVNLRGLGCDQTLVLLNGRRWIQNAQGCVDLNQIPLSIVDRIEILDGGASAMFGEGAIAGVINVVTTSKFDGAQARAQFGKYLDHSDGEAQAFDVSIGSQSDRASVFFNASYVQSEPVLAGDRVISSEPQYGTGTAFGSSGTPQGRFGFFNPATGTFSNSWTTDPGCNVGNQGLSCFRVGDFSFGAPGAGSDRFNFAPANYLLTPLERTNIFTQGRYELSDRVGISVAANYSGRVSQQQLGPHPLFLGIFGSGPAANIGVGQLNPYNPTGRTLPASSWLLGRRMVEAGPRLHKQSVDTYRFGLALDGEFDVANRAWQWNLDYIYSKNDAHQVTEGLFNLNRIREALSDDCVTGAIAGCVPLNVFGGAGTITQPMIDYIGFTAQDSATNTLRSHSGRLQGPLFDLPAGPLEFTVGYDWRSEASNRLPDAIVQSNQTTAGPRLTMRGGIKTKSIYASAVVPLLADLPGVDLLQLSLSARHLDFSPPSGPPQARYQLNGTAIDPAELIRDQDDVSSSIGLLWRVTDQMSLRGRLSRDVAAPSIEQLHGGTVDRFPTFSDPCNGGAAANPDLPGCAHVANGYQQVGAQHRVTTGSNPYLKPVTADSWNLGLRYEPEWLSGLIVDAGLMDIELENGPIIIGFQTILNLCATSLQYCQFIQRGHGGQIYGNDLFDVAVNELQSRTQNADFVVQYQYKAITLDWQGVYSIRASQTFPRSSFTSITVDLTENDYEGTNQGDFAVPRWKSNLGLTWSNKQWDATWRMRYIHHQRERCDAQSYGGYTLPPNAPNGGQPYCNLGPDNVGGTDPTLPGGGPDGVFDYRKLGSVTYHDVQLNYHIGDWDTQLTFGVNNLFDKGPPLSQTAFANSFDSSVYDTPGRFPYIRVTTDF